ncbi:hypothetical protein ACES2I_07850 [Bdellovibrio bacteriovorus]|uniref:hypothetical protein n=1 Tax=Bdellovibrio bacteriovorus TaxID=959 RepID=UPI0035A709D3
MTDIKKDFESFAEDGSPAGSSFVLNKINSTLQDELPSPWKVAGKLGLAHTVATSLTLASCSQFGVTLFNTGHDLMHSFMGISETFCHSLCGAYYLAATFLLARMILNREEWLVLLKNRTLSIASLALLSLGVFSSLSHEVTWESALLWFFGAALGAELMTVRKQALKRLLHDI